MADQLFVHDDSDDDSISITSTQLSEEGMYDVERVLAKREMPDSDPMQHEYLIKWERYTLARATWEVKEAFQDQAILNKFRKHEKAVREGRERPYDIQQWYEACEEAQKASDVRKKRRKEKRRRRGIAVSPGESEDQSTKDDAIELEEGEISRPSSSSSIPLAAVAANARRDSSDSDAPLANRFNKATTTKEPSFPTDKAISTFGSKRSTTSSPSPPSSGASTPANPPRAMRKPKKPSIFMPKPYRNLMHQNNARSKARIEPPPTPDALPMVDPATGKIEPPKINPAQPAAIPEPQSAPPERRELVPEAVRRINTAENDLARQIARAPHIPRERKASQDYLVPYDGDDPPDPYERRNWVCWFWAHRGHCRFSDQACWFAHAPAPFPPVLPADFVNVREAKAREIAHERRARFESRNQQPTIAHAQDPAPPVFPAPVQPIMAIPKWADRKDLHEAEIFQEWKGHTPPFHRHVFVLMPADRAEETVCVVEWLRSVGCKTYLSNTSGAWENFRDKLNCSRAIIMDTHAQYYDLPEFRKYLAHKHNGNVFYWGLQDIVHSVWGLPIRFSCERIFPRGEVIYLTEELIVYHPQKASEVIRKVIRKNGDPAYKIWCRPGIIHFLLTLLENNNTTTDPLYLLRGQLYCDFRELCPLEQEELLDQETPELRRDHQTPLPTARLISYPNALLKMSGEGEPWLSRMEEFDKKSPPQCDPERADWMADAFVGWTVINSIVRHRYFTICHMEEKDVVKPVIDEKGRYTSVIDRDPRGWQKKEHWQHISVERPEDIFARWDRENLPESERPSRRK